MYYIIYYFIYTVYTVYCKLIYIYTYIFITTQESNLTQAVKEMKSTIFLDTESGWLRVPGSVQERGCSKIRNKPA